MNAKGTANIKGIDISGNNGMIDFSKVKASGVQAVITKATEGTTFTNPLFHTHTDGLKAAGIPFGCYHWLTVKDADYAKNQAAYFWNAIRDSGFTCRPSLDVEERKADKAEITAEVSAFLAEFKRLSGIDAMIYASTNYIQTYFDKSLSAYPLWVAHYGVNEPGDNGVWDGYTGWQYSSAGSIPGISGNVDCDNFTDGIMLAVAKPAAPAPKKSTFPGAQYFGVGKSNDYILMLDKALISHGYAKYYKYGANGASRSWGNGTFTACRAFQQAQGWRGSDADGIPGPVTWDRLGL